MLGVMCSYKIYIFYCTLTVPLRDASELLCRMLGVMEQGMPLDKEKHSTLSATMARNIMGVVIIMLVQSDRFTS